MSLVLQETLVALLVAGCALYSLWRLLPARLQLRCLDLAGAVPGVRAARWHATLRERTLARPGCGGCVRGATPGAAAPNQTAGAPRR